jgi:DNA processing protein
MLGVAVIEEALALRAAGITAPMLAWLNGPGEDFAAALAAVDLDRECDLIARHGVRLLALGSPGYPAALAAIPTPPHLLYVRGRLTPADDRAVAVVGSRGCTSYGRRVTEQLATGLVRAGYTVVSGLARGIDGAAHAAALKAGGRTVAVLAGGLARIYPPEHAELAVAVQEAGALVSEAPMDAEPLPGMFPPRNRIISGLARAVVVVEAAERSGTLITARHAAEQGREVFAVPGPVDSPASAGCLHLIRTGATLARHVDDILEVIGSSSPAAPAPAATSA